MGRLRAGDLVCPGVCCAAIVRHLGGISPQTVERMKRTLSSKRQDPRSREDPRTKRQARLDCPVAAEVTRRISWPARATVISQTRSNRDHWNLDLGSSLDLGSWILDLRSSLDLGSWRLVLRCQ